MKFTVGEVVSSSAVSSSLERCKTGDFRKAIKKMVRRHVRGEWGSRCEEGKRLNEIALNKGYKIVSKYEYNNKSYFIMTEKTRTYTIILECWEY